jgi:hypothetical protein
LTVRVTVRGRPGENAEAATSREGRLPSRGKRATRPASAEGDETSREAPRSKTIRPTGRMRGNDDRVRRSRPVVTGTRPQCPARPIDSAEGGRSRANRRRGARDSAVAPPNRRERVMRLSVAPGVSDGKPMSRRRPTGDSPRARDRERRAGVRPDEAATPSRSPGTHRNPLKRRNGRRRISLVKLQ